jgi:dTDP-4-dehydrorhamnose 3,5-epimerase
MMLKSATKDRQQVTGEWHKLQEGIEGVVVHEVRHVPRDHGVITEIYRPQWDPSGLPVVHIYQSRLFPAAIGAWSCHARTIDRLFINQGHVKVVLYDGREDSPTCGRVMELHAGDARPAFVVIPIGVWHGIQNLGASDALMLNCPSRAYDYEDPDHYRLPFDSPEIPYAWHAGGARLRANPRPPAASLNPD